MWKCIRKTTLDRQPLPIPAARPGFVSRASLSPEPALAPKCSLKLPNVPRNQHVCIAEWPRMSVSARSIKSEYRVRPQCTPDPMGQPGPPSGAQTAPTKLSAKTLNLRPRTTDALDVSPCRDHP